MSEYDYLGSPDYLASRLKFERKFALFNIPIFIVLLVCMLLLVWDARNARELFAACMALAEVGLVASWVGETLREIRRITIQLVIAKLEQ